MARCGCASGCGCRHTGGPGVKTTGTGAVGDPIRVELRSPMDAPGADIITAAVADNLGAGMGYTGGNLVAKISADAGNNLTYGVDGGLFGAGGGGGAESGFATVQSLIDQADPVLGGTYGGGWARFPDGPLYTYEAGLAMDLPLMHVPVRRTSDGVLYAAHQRDLSVYNWRFTWTIDTIDQAMASMQWLTPGGDYLSFTLGYKGLGVQNGYFGGHMLDQWGLTSLAQVFSLVQRRSVLLLEVMDIGSGSGDTANPATTFALLRSLIRRFGLTKSVIVCATWPTAGTSAERTAILAGLASMTADGIATAVRIPSTTVAASATPTWMTTNNITWALIHIDVADAASATVLAYKNAGRKVLLYPAHRQWHWSLMKNTVKFGAGGLRGVLATDPAYVGGELTGYRYRRLQCDWRTAPADIGRHSPWSAQMAFQSTHYRGYVGDTGWLSLDGDLHNPTDNDASRQSGYFVTAGEINPIASAQYDLEFGVSWAGMGNFDRSRWAGVWIGSPEDRHLLQYTEATVNTKGYDIALTCFGQLTFHRYDGVAGAPGNPPIMSSLVWGAGWGELAAGVEYRIKIRVRSDRIIIGPAHEATNGPNTRTLMDTTWRGPYVYLGRHFFNPTQSVKVSFHDVIVTPV